MALPRSQIAHMDVAHWLLKPRICWNQIPARCTRHKFELHQTWGTGRPVEFVEVVWHLPFRTDFLYLHELAIVELDVWIFCPQGEPPLHVNKAISVMVVQCCRDLCTFFLRCKMLHCKYVYLQKNHKTHPNYHPMFLHEACQVAMNVSQLQVQLPHLLSSIEWIQGVDSGPALHKVRDQVNALSVKHGKLVLCWGLSHWKAPKACSARSSTASLWLCEGGRACWWMLVAG